MYVVFDIGGTKTRVAYSVDGKSFEEPIVEHTPENYVEGLSMLKDIFERASNGREIKAYAGGAPGPYDFKNDRFTVFPNIPNWNAESIIENLSSTLNAPIYMGNDADVVGLGEAVYGAGKGFSHVAYITVSTGVGGVRIVDGKIDHGRYSFEPGHQMIFAHGKGMTLEDATSGGGVERRLGISAKNLTDQEEWQRITEALATGMASTLRHWSPNVLVLGGSMITGSPCLPLELFENLLKEKMIRYPELPTVKKAELGDFGGLYGALALIESKL